MEIYLSKRAVKQKQRGEEPLVMWPESGLLGWSSRAQNPGLDLRGLDLISQANRS